MVSLAVSLRRTVDVLLVDKNVVDTHRLPLDILGVEIEPFVIRLVIVLLIVGGESNACLRVFCKGRAHAVIVGGFTSEQALFSVCVMHDEGNGASWLLAVAVKGGKCRSQPLSTPDSRPIANAFEAKRVGRGGQQKMKHTVETCGIGEPVM